MITTDERDGRVAGAPLTFVLIGGFPRGGTTALVDLLNESDDAAIMAEYRLTDLMKDIENIFNYGQLTERRDEDLAAKIAGSSKTGELPSYQPFNTPTVSRDLRYPRINKFGNIVANIVRASLDKPAARIIGSKTPGSILLDRGGMFDRHITSAKCVAMLRSPAGLINSTLNRRNRHAVGLDVWHIASIEEAIAEYERIAGGLVALSELFGDDVLFIKYEDLISDTGTTCKRLFDHLGLDFAPSHKMFFSERGAIDVLTAEERIILEDRLGSVEDRWAEARLTGTSSEVDLSLFYSLLPSPPKSAIAIGGHVRPLFIAGGWSHEEEVGLWTEQKRASLVFAPADGERWLMKIGVVPNLAAGKPLGIRCSVNGRPIGDVTLCPGEAVVGPLNTSVAVPNWQDTMSMWFGPLELRAEKPNVIEFEFEGAISPKELGDPLDDRLLGFSLRSIEFVKAPEFPS